MEKKEYEMPEEYKKNLAHLTEFLEAREEYRATIKAGLARGVKVSAADKAMVDEKLREFDQIIDRLETSLAAEYDRYQAEQAREEEISEITAQGMDAAKRLYIITKYQVPHLLDEFTKCLDPLSPEQREEFLDEVAILEATKLDAILKGEE
jgi:glutamyl-tRNA reductase